MRHLRDSHTFGQLHERFAISCFVLMMFLAPCLGVASPCDADRNARIDITVDADSDLGELYDFWNVFPVTVQTPFLDETQHAALRQSYRYAKYINCVRLLGGIDLKKDDYFRGVDARGQAVCDFSGAVAVLSGIRKCGFTPWIVSDNVPAAMCSKPKKPPPGNLWVEYLTVRMLRICPFHRGKAASRLVVAVPPG